MYILQSIFSLIFINFISIRTNKNCWKVDYETILDILDTNNF